MSDTRAYWQSTYAEKTPENVSWYEPLPRRSIELVEKAHLGRHAGVLDVGGGASSLAAQLLGMGYTDLTVADISAAALAHARAQLGSDAERVTWIEADIRGYDFARRFDLWRRSCRVPLHGHPGRPRGYLSVLRATLRPGGHLIIATFGPQGPTRCSGLPVQRYSAEQLRAHPRRGLRPRVVESCQPWRYPASPGDGGEGAVSWISPASLSWSTCRVL